MSPRGTAILFAIALALGAFIFFYELRGERGSSVSDPELRRIFSEAPLDPDLVESISFATEEGTPVRVERREGRWWLVEPVDAPADQREIDGMASTLVHLSSEGVIEQPQAASVYGLDDETQVLRFRAAGREYGLRVGGKTPVGPNSYVASLTSDQTFIVSTWKIKSPKSFWTTHATRTRSRRPRRRACWTRWRSRSRSTNLGCSTGMPMCRSEVIGGQSAAS